MDHQSAFPHEGGNKFVQGNEVRKTLPSHGMTLRDYFAGKCLPNLSRWHRPEEAAARAYEYADAMLKERAKPCS